MADAIAIPFPHSQRSGIVFGVTMENLWLYVGPILKATIPALVLFALGALLYRKQNFELAKQNQTQLRETADGWEKLYKQRGEEILVLSDSFKRLQIRFSEQERQFHEITTLNLTLQLEIKARDVTIAELKGQIGVLEAQVDILQRKLASLKS
jgi:hypothetical protein